MTIRGHLMAIHIQKKPRQRGCCRGDYFCCLYCLPSLQNADAIRLISVIGFAELKVRSFHQSREPKKRSR